MIITLWCIYHWSRFAVYSIRCLILLVELFISVFALRLLYCKFINVKKT